MAALIGRFEHLPNRPRSDEARPLLEKIASQVKPIMAKRSWKVGTLAEFLPSNPALLGNNMNAGQRINLRLRPPGNESTFYEYDQLVLVMLHELTHIEHGPHDAQFYKLLAVLEEEFYELKRKGYSGEGFHGQGHAVSGFKVPEHIGKSKGLQAAEKRLAVQRKIGKGGVLGGSTIQTAGKTMKEVLAEAAERRIRDDKACHPVDDKEVPEEIRKAQEESVGIDADQLPGNGRGQAGSTSASSSGIEAAAPAASPINPPITITSTKSSLEALPTKPISKPLGTKRLANGTPRQIIDLTTESNNPSKPPPPTKSTSTPNPHPNSQPKRTKPLVIDEINEWSCPTCTLLNPLHILQCEACNTPKPVIRKSDGQSWFCEFCGAGPRDMGFWSCGDCGWVRKWG